MAPLPKRRHSTKRKGTRVHAKKLRTLPALVVCKNCGKMKTSHRVCRSCNK